MPAVDKYFRFSIYSYKADSGAKPKRMLVKNCRADKAVGKCSEKDDHKAVDPTT